MDCLYCKLVAGELPVYKIKENDSCLSFLDINPISRGHTLVIPKKHAESILVLNDGEIAAVFSSVRQTVEILKESLMPDGFNIGINMHKAGGQAIEHLHIHIIPRWQGDGGGSMHSIVANPPSEALEELLALITKK